MSQHAKPSSPFGVNLAQKSAPSNKQFIQIKETALVESADDGEQAESSVSTKEQTIGGDAALEASQEQTATKTEMAQQQRDMEAQKVLEEE